MSHTKDETVHNIALARVYDGNAEPVPVFVPDMVFNLSARFLHSPAVMMCGAPMLEQKITFETVHGGLALWYPILFCETPQKQQSTNIRALPNHPRVQTDPLPGISSCLEEHRHADHSKEHCVVAERN
jgi:hypothetical protein